MDSTRDQPDLATSSEAGGALIISTRARDRDGGNEFGQLAVEQRRRPLDIPLPLHDDSPECAVGQVHRDLRGIQCSAVDMLWQRVQLWLGSSGLAPAVVCPIWRRSWCLCTRADTNDATVPRWSRLRPCWWRTMTGSGQGLCQS